MKDNTIWLSSPPSSPEDFPRSLSTEDVLQLVRVAEAARLFLEESLDPATNMTTYLATQRHLEDALKEFERRTE